MSDAGWSEDRVTTLTSLWLDGLSASQIAKQLGGRQPQRRDRQGPPPGPVRPRGAVDAGACRGDFSAETAPPGSNGAGLARAVPASSRLAPAPLRPAEGPGLVDNLVHLPVHACKWPIGDPKAADFTFCGRRTDGRYCAAHEALGVRAGTASRLDRDPVVRRALAGLI